MTDIPKVVICFCRYTYKNFAGESERGKRVEGWETFFSEHFRLPIKMKNAKMRYALEMGPRKIGLLQL
jgi:hypothetical protein